MEEMYGFHPSSSSSGYTILPENDLISPMINHNFRSPINHFWSLFGSDDLLSVAASVITDSVSVHEATRDQSKVNDDGDDHDDDDVSGHIIKDKIVSHPSYSKLLDAYIDCQKMGAPSDISCLLDDIQHKNDVRYRRSSCFGVDPELDEFMETFCRLLVKYKSDLARPFDEATVFLGNIETQLRNLGKVDCTDESNISSEEDVGGGETNNTQISQELKDTLLSKFGGRISTIKHEFTKTKKKGKLPREARQMLLQWWNSHYKWPYPTEGDKISLAETTGLDPKQINNWFINQRKRHWKPSEIMQLAVMGGLPGRFLNND